MYWYFLSVKREDKSVEWLLSLGYHHAPFMFLFHPCFSCICFSNMSSRLLSTFFLLAFRSSLNPCHTREGNAIHLCSAATTTITTTTHIYTRMKSSSMLSGPIHPFARTASPLLLLMTWTYDARPVARRMD